jgi:hypothetical protein
MSLYRLQSKDLKDLGPERAVDFFRRLLWAEALRVNIGRHLIDAPGCINVGDGGLDAVIENARPISEDVIPAGISGFQIKSSDLQPAECKKELYSNGNLKPGIKRILDENGVYILVLFKDMTHETMKRDRESAIIEELAKLGYSSPKIRIYTITQIIGFAERFPSLVSWLKGYSNEYLPYQKWAECGDVSSPKKFISDEQRTNIIMEIRETLRKSNEKMPIIRIAGLSGLGKTRLVFEALSQYDLKNTVLYTTAEELKNSSLRNMLLVDDSVGAIVVVDECSLENHDYFVNLFSNQGPRLALITISNDVTPISLPTLYYQLKPLQRSDVEKLLAEDSKELPQNVIHRLADFAEGYPGFALLLSKNYVTNSSNTQDILNASPALFIKKLIAGNIDPESDWFRKTKDVLMALSLFETVGFNGDLISEAKYAASLVGVNWDEFQKVVREQKQQGIVKGEYYVGVTPFPLAVYLLREWWEIYGGGLDFVALIKSMPKAMLDRFFSRFPYITPVESGRRKVEELLSAEGIFADGLLLKTEKGASLFLNLTEADPRSALECLKRTVGTWNKQQLLQFETGRRQIVWALEKMAVWQELFADAAKLLLALGEAENESYANNASGVFTDLFSPGWGPLAPTEVSLEERLPILFETISSASIERKKLALNALRRALESSHFSRMIGAEYQGSKPIPQLWAPKTSGEILEHYTRVWTYLEENLGTFADEIKDDALKVILGSSRGLASIHPSLSEMVRETIRKLSGYSWVDKAELIKTVSMITHYDGKRMPQDALRDWVALRNDLIGSSYSDLMKRFVGMDLLEDYFHNSEKYDTKWVESKIDELAKRVIENPNLLDFEYSWLTTEKAKRGHQFGYHLGMLDKDFSFLEKLLEQQRSAGSTGSLGFVGGYFRALFEREVSLWEDRLDSLSEDNSFKGLILELTWRSGITDRAAKRLLTMLQKGDITIDGLGIFRFGGVIQKLSEPVFIEWAVYLLKESSGIGSLILLDLIYYYYVFKETKTLPQELTLDLLLHPVFWDNPRNLQRGQMVDFVWKKVATRLISTFPDTGSVIAEQIMKFFGDERSIACNFRSETISEVLLEITKKNPSGIWQKLIKHLDPPSGKRAFFLKEWLKGNRDFGKDDFGALELFNIEDVWKWVDEKPEERAQFLAHCVSPVLFHSADKICLARELLARYGGHDEVRSSFSSNYLTEGWTGPASIHYMTKKKALLDFKKDEKDENVIKWIDEYLEILEQDIERAKIAEEKGQF